ncbi:carbon-nitrogen hydrolase [Nocardia sp. CDC159]|uniref:Carbon-nitrogen hydrolase n=1 Tax=Nocardia pulmonis TaxID=2951408 RepID=A0A9X2IVL6_9NOCA|nr:MULTISPECIES: nitrilase-related carbon-nitrogen hydrolase [Nocardia]MCM6771925.1 carbon-nitrogen hydrolase [Nocardia pulmonis]MCM6785417.1 carbon-nitrogen hydrolase [Nocardia sp. CDC159]
MTRVAAAQLAAGTDVADNLAACLRMIDAAASVGAELVVLPEFCNHLSWYADRAHAHRMACTAGDFFLTAIAERAARHAMLVKIGVTMARPDGRTTGTGLLFGPGGALLGESDKQILMGAENDHLDPGSADSPVVTTRLGRIGMYACMEGVIPEVARSLAARGAQLLLNSLNSFAIDEASLHIPVRAAENKVWVVAANKVGPLLPEDLLPTVAERLGVPADRLYGAGESQIVAPDGTVLAKAPATGEAIVVTDVDLTLADDKHRPDGTDLFRARRPELYRPLAHPARRRAPAGAESVSAAVVAPDAEAVRTAVAAGARLIALPELAAVPVPDVVAALRDSDAHAVLTVRDRDRHTGLLLAADGIVGRQDQLHRTERHPWLHEVGSELAVFTLPWGRLAIVVGDDALFPETFRLAAIADADVAVVCHTPAEPWEQALGLPERSAENRLNVVAAGLGPTGESTGAIHALSPDFTLWTQWRGPFTGVISHPVTTVVPPGTTCVQADIRPAEAVNRAVSRGTDLLADRPPAALANLIRELELR